MSTEDKVMTLSERLAEAEELLENVFYWETCPDDYKERIKKICIHSDLYIDDEE